MILFDRVFAVDSKGVHKVPDTVLDGCCVILDLGGLLGVKEERVVESDVRERVGGGDASGLILISGVGL